jgi:hypothetical protein
LLADQGEGVRLHTLEIERSRRAVKTARSGAELLVRRDKPAER